MKLMNRLSLLGALLMGFGFGLVTATGFFPHESTFWMRFAGGGIITAGILILAAGRHRQQKDRVNEKHDA